MAQLQTDALALPLGELSPKVTERALQALLNGNINLCAHATYLRRKRYQSFRSWGVISLRNRRAFSSWLLSFGMVMFFPLSRLRRQLSQRESQVPRVTHYTERCIEVRSYLFGKSEFAGPFDSILSDNRIRHKNSHSTSNCCDCYCLMNTAHLAEGFSYASRFFSSRYSPKSVRSKVRGITEITLSTSTASVSSSTLAQGANTSLPQGIYKSFSSGRKSSE